MKHPVGLSNRVTELERRVRDLEDRKEATSHSHDSISRPSTRQERKGEIHYSLSSNKKVTIGNWHGSKEESVTLVHIREYYE